MAYYDLRYRVLRAPLNQPRGSEKNDGDIDNLHLALFVKDEIIAIGRLDDAEGNLMQARFVAVEEDRQGQGLGKAIMLEMEKIAKGQGKIGIVLQARDYAVDFYKNLGYDLIKNPICYMTFCNILK